MGYQLASTMAGVMMAYQVLEQPHCVSESRDDELAAKLGADLDEARQFRDWVLAGMSELAFQETSMVAGVIMAHRIIALASDPDSVGEELSDSEVLAVMGADPDEAHQFRDWLLERLMANIATAQNQARLAVSQACISYLMEHSHSVHASNGGISDDYRRFVLDLVRPGGPGEGLPVAELASATGIPAATWEELLASLTVPIS